MKKSKYKEFQKMVVYRPDRELEEIKKVALSNLETANLFLSESIHLGVEILTIDALNSAFNSPEKYCEQELLAGIDEKDIPEIGGMKMLKQKFFDEMLQKPDTKAFCEMAGSLRKMNFRLAVTVIELKDQRVLFSKELMKKTNESLTVHADVESGKQEELFAILHGIVNGFTELFAWTAKQRQGERIRNYILRKNVDFLLQVYENETVYLNPILWKDLIGEID